MSYLPIEDYGIIGDLHTVALVGKNGSIDWWCYPNFDSPSIFAALLDEERGGHFLIEPVVEGGVSNFTTKQLYFPDTNVLITRFLSEDGVGELTDFMPIKSVSQQEFHHRLVRKVEVVRGTMRFRVRCTPAFDYARVRHEVLVVDDGAIFVTPALSLGMSTGTKLEQDGDGVVGEFTLRQGESCSFELGEVKATTTALERPNEQRIGASFSRTVEFWRGWLSKSTYRGRWREMVNRSALTLKLLTFAPTGAIVAAPTTSLPEGIGGVRNWDYRYTWIRDASFTLYGLLRIGFTDEASAFMDWLKARLQELHPSGSPLQIMYSIHGDHSLTEQTLDHLEGYRKSSPVRIGNGAYNQLQLDIYGELMDAVYLFNKHGAPIGFDLWLNLRRCIDWVCDNWHRPDEGIWEVRGGRQHFVYSKVMSWVALDRAIRLADKRSFPAPRQRWLETRDEIYEEIMRQGWSEERQSFVQAYGSSTLDAANLTMPLVFFLAPSDPRMTATLDATMKHLMSDSLVYRYVVDEAGDGLAGEEGTFSICTFWLVEALTRAGRTDEARLIFEKMLTYANHLGLYSEEIGPRGEALGNFPQAFTHLALISAAFNLDLALGRPH